MQKTIASFLIVLGGALSVAREANESEPVPLPAPDREGGMALTAALAGRKSVRTFTDRILSTEELGQLLWAADGENRPNRRTAPSAGATYPLEIYVFTPEGVWQYLPADHALRKTMEGDLRARLSEASLSQGSIREAAVSIVLVAVYERTTQRYGDRGIMYVHIEAGHVAQNVHLQAAALGLGSVPVGAFQPSEVAGLLNLPENQEPIYILPVGEPK